VKRFEDMRFAFPWPGLSAALLATVSALGANAAGIPVGHLGALTCSMDREGAGGSGRNATGRAAWCEFRLRERAPSETYTGTFQFIGQDSQAEAGAETMLLIVKAPISTLPLPGMLEQRYAADAASSQHPGASSTAPLIGEKASFLVLQPEPSAATEPTLALGRPRIRILVSIVLELRSSTS
jgi:hypothetical protein